MSLNWSWMNYAVQVCGWALGLPLELLVVAVLLRGGYRRFPVLFGYTIASFLTTLIEISLEFVYYRTGDPQVLVRAARAYWINEWILQFLVFAVVISLIYQATTAARSRRVVRAALILGAILFAGISLAIHFRPGPKFGPWMTPWTRDLNFGAAILDLALWGMLLAAREKDRRVLMLSGGLGLQFTGGAIGESIRSLSTRNQSHALSFGGGVVAMLANLLCLYVWWQTLRAPLRNGPGRPLGPSEIRAATK